MRFSNSLLRFRFVPAPLVAWFLLPIAFAENDEIDKILEGHSHVGSAFNEGARQSAYLMDGLSEVHLRITTESEEAQQFFNQGLAQLHGFWYLEAERSFRQVVTLDPECAMGYWGMAMANFEGDENRALQLMEQAKERREQAAKHEQMHIDALHGWLERGKDDKRKGRRNQEYVDELQEIILEYPEDIETKAFLACRLWQFSRKGLPIHSHVAVDALIQQVFAKDPMHPAHHYRIHLWDRKKPAVALDSAAKCGPSSPNIAHMWHMPGHIYSRLRRYNDAAWQQEASARVDHAHMMRARVLPDQIHNYAHNNEWLIRNLINVGRMSEALDLAKNMIELPRHPKYNTFSKSGSYSYGRDRLFDVLEKFELWPEAATLAETPYLEPTHKLDAQARRLVLLGNALYQMGDMIRADTQVDRLKELLESLPESEERDAKRRRENVEQKLNELLGYQALKAEEPERALEHFEKARAVAPVWRARAKIMAGAVDEGIEIFRDDANRNRGEAIPLAQLAHAQFEAVKVDEAKATFEQLREIAAHADLTAPVFARLSPLAEEAGYEADWRPEAVIADDTGERPDLDALGPFRWEPSPAPVWELPNEQGETSTLSRFKGRPMVLIHFLGAGCLHCVEQIQVFAAKSQEFALGGLTLVAISTDDPETMRTAAGDFDKDGVFPMVFLSDDKMESFKDYRAYDDFEDLPLHGTYIIDSEGMIRWQDISYEPFTDAEFVLNEARRLLKL